MKINPFTMQKAVNLYQTNDVNSRKPELGESNQRRQDKVTLSDESVSLFSIKKAANDSSDIRKEKIQVIQERIEKGIYTIDSRRVADKIIQNIPLDKKI